MAPTGVPSYESESVTDEGHHIPSTLRLHTINWSLDDLKVYSEGADKTRAFYNRMLPFAQHDNHISSTSAAYELGADTAKTLQEIDGIFSTALDQIRKKSRILQDQAHQFYKETMALPEAYEGGDLLSLTSVELEQVMKHIKIGDPERFGEYVVRIISQSPTAARAPDEADEDDDPDPEVFTGKCYTLIQTMIHLNLRRQALRALVELKSLLHQRNPRWQSDDCLDLHEDLDHMLLAFAEKTYRPEWVRTKCNEKARPKDHSKHVCSFRVYALRWRLGPGSRPIFWDFASSCRVLRAAYKAQTCSTTGWECFHGCTANVLEWLRKKAWAEIRAKTFLTIGTLLPPELTVAVFTYALNAEGIPANPAVWKKKRIEPSVLKISSENAWEWKAKKKYRCRKELVKNLRT